MRILCSRGNSKLIQVWLDFRDAMLIIAGMNAVLMFPTWFLLKARLPPRTPPPFGTILGS